MNTSRSSAMKYLLITGLCLAFSPPAHAGAVSKLITQGGKKIGQSAAKDVAKETVTTAAEKALLQIEKKYGSQVVSKLDEVVQHTGIPKDQLLKEIQRYGDVYRRAGFSSEALEFGVRNGQAGRFFVSRPDLFAALKRSNCLGPGREQVVKESWKLVHGTGGSWASLRNALTVTGMNSGLSRDFTESLFINRVKAGGHPAFPKGTELFSGHISQNGKEVRQGIDFLCPKKNEPLRVIEFGTGKKPTSADELSWDRVRKNLADYVENAPNKDQLRDAGMPRELLVPKNLRDPNFPIHDFVTREIHAPEIDKRFLKDLGPGTVRAVELP